MPASIACICGYRGPAVTADAGTVCPICRTPAASAGPAGPAAGQPPAPGAVSVPAVGPTAGGLPPFTEGARGPLTGMAAAATPAAPPAAPPAALHIPCPRGHVLDAPASMLGQRVVCPKCNEFFVLDAENSVERREQRDREIAEREAREARRWLVRAIWVAATVIAALIAMIFVSTLQK